MKAAKLYHVGEDGLVEGESLGSLCVYLKADYDQLKAENERLSNCIRKAKGFYEKFERNWYLVSDERDTLRKQLDEARELLTKYGYSTGDIDGRVDAWLVENKP